MALVTPMLLLALAARVDAELFPPTFRAFETGPEPWSVCAADFNADGRPDLAVATLGNGSEHEYVPGAVSVLLGNGDGTYGARTDLVGIHTTSLATADLNGDGRADLAMTNWGSNCVSVLPGNGDGTFGAGSDFATGINPNWVTIADLNGDGRPDLATANYNANTVSVLLGNGDGTFQPRADFDVGIIPYSVAAADLNADGRRDLAVVNRINTVSVLLGNGDGTFRDDTEFGVGEDPRGIAIGDLNADGRLDLAVANLNSNSISVLFGNGDGTFQGRTDVSPGGRPHSLAIADLNADDRADLAVANWGPSTIGVLLGNGDGTFGAPNGFLTQDENLSVAVADLNRDGRPDLAACGAGGSSEPHAVSVLLGNGDGTFGARSYATAASPWSVAIADLDVNGSLDLVTANNTGTVSVLPGKGDGTFGTRYDYFTGAESVTSSVAIADLNNDGWPDLAVVNRAASAVTVLLGVGGGAFGVATSFDTGPSPIQVAIADFNADGRPDLTVANSGANTVSVLLGNGDGRFAPSTDFVTGSNNSSVAAADLNRDGRPDLAVVKHLGSTVAVLIGNGDGTFGAVTDFGTDLSPTQVAIGDLNADGKPDLAVTTDSGTVSVLLNWGSGTFMRKTDFHVGRGPLCPVIADFDADGGVDIAVPRYNENVASMLLGNGRGSFEQTDHTCGNFPVSAAVADLNGDGRLDLAVANHRSNTVSVLLNGRSASAPIAMGFHLEPDAVDLSSPILWMTGFLEVAWPLALGDVDISSIRLNDGVPVDAAAPTTFGDRDGDGVPDLRVEFDRLAFEQAASPGEDVLVIVTGTMDGRPFLGTDPIRVRRASVSHPAAGSHVAAGSVAQARWETPDGVMADSVALLFSFDGGSTWSLIARRRPNTGSCEWTVPDVQTEQAKLAVVLVESADETGDIVDGVIGVSDAFSIEAVVEADEPQVQFALAIRGAGPNPSPDGRLGVDFTLRDGSPARLELIDVAGRVLISLQVGTLGPGRHTLDLSRGRTVAPGIYFLRLRQGGREVRVRATLLR